MHMAKTDQAAQTHSSSNRNTSAQPYRGTHIYVHFLTNTVRLSAQSELGKRKSS